jgi:hypothetical protein
MGLAEQDRKFRVLMKLVSFSKKLNFLRFVKVLIIKHSNGKIPIYPKHSIWRFVS